MNISYKQNIYLLFGIIAIILMKYDLKPVFFIILVLANGIELNKSHEKIICLIAFQCIYESNFFFQI